jgi:hypothetical protein
LPYSDLLCARPGKHGLTELARAFFKVIGTEDSEQRHSSNYVEETYFRGSLEGVKFTVCWADYDGNEDLPFWVMIEGDQDTDDALNAVVDRVVRERLLGAGFRVARVVNFGKLEGALRIDF